MLFILELRKTLGTWAILAVGLAAIGFNALLILVPDVPGWSGTAEVGNVFEDYDASDIAEHYIQEYEVEGYSADTVRTLYGHLQPVIDAKASRGDSLSWYLGERTTYIHQQLFGLVLPIAIVEACLLGLTLALMSLGYETARDTEKLVASTVTGRMIWVWKVVASLTASLATSAVILGTTLGVFFARFDFSTAWEDQVSSGFNWVWTDNKPFITWDRLTVGDYLSASLCVAGGLVVFFTLFGVVIGSVIRHQWAASVTGLVAILVVYLLGGIAPDGHLVAGIIHMTPVWLCLESGQWFTDGGVNALWPHFETWGLLYFLALFIGLAVAAFFHYKHRDLS